MLDHVEIKDASVLEIGCGDGFLTHSILQTPMARLWVFEIDQEWVAYITQKYKDARLQVYHENILDSDFQRLEPSQPWTLLANLPYQITFPLLHALQQQRALFKEGVIMVQEEVAQKILKKQGRDYGYASLFFQYYFEWKLLVKVEPSAFYPPPKVHSRLLYFKPKNPPAIEQEELFWKFIKVCFKQPRRTLKNNLEQTHIDIGKIDPAILAKRAQQMSISDLLALWHIVR
jgi:16S rRNA (adenine1518-N6/adenine1519-N6)-dimethyltransferase